MPHSLIIQLTSERPGKKEHLTIFDLTDDPILRAHSDWAGAEGDFTECANDIAAELRPICFINKGRRTLRFKSDETLRKRYVHTLSTILKEVSACLSGRRKGQPSLRNHSDITGALERLYDVSRILFYYETADYVPACHTLSQLVLSRLNGKLPKTLYIGGILDYHYS